ncbi:52 kDa repressor of the inhibitor of the protein kinase-like [Stegodyphus dumicola]|uniref:52 kDa repressor of the inhibitor of the protein kinase-like n=1 Tax=Stegodyphus dumicola TaxID=202533 RepID=UPI0015B26559|nr:52 kDa repressor of the inhibitor of the protein kinase-like [Stegodyphus dumicola]
MFRKDDHRNSPDSLSVSKQPKSWYRCCVCGTTSRKTPDRKFFRFPKDPIRSKQWAAACSNQDLLNKSPTDLYKTALICSSHFQRSRLLFTKDAIFTFLCSADKI